MSLCRSLLWSCLARFTRLSRHGQFRVRVKTQCSLDRGLFKRVMELQPLQDDAAMADQKSTFPGGPPRNTRARRTVGDTGGQVQTPHLNLFQFHGPAPIQILEQFFAANSLGLHLEVSGSYPAQTIRETGCSRQFGEIDAVELRSDFIYRIRQKPSIDFCP